MRSRAQDDQRRTFGWFESRLVSHTSKPLQLRASEPDPSNATVRRSQIRFAASFSFLNRERYISMSKKLYVGNLAFQTTSQDLQQLFAQAGTVESASVIEDRDTGR